jgi:uncharacterized protein (UPF0548 family)
MLWVRKPTTAQMGAFLASQTGLDLSYGAVGATATRPPPGYDVDHTRVQLGTGEATFTAAAAALRRWQHFRLAWVEAWPAETPIREGQVIVIQARILGLWWLNACRIVSVAQEDGAVMRFGFTYGTLPDHAESGEERFLIEWDRAGGAVWYDILAFSRPRHWLARVGYPLTRRLQTRFACGSAAAMRLAVAATASADQPST